MSQLSNKLTSRVQSPGPGWATLQEPTSAESDVEIVEGPLRKKRKNGAEPDVHDHGDPRLNIKRPRHSISGPEISGSSKSGQTSFGSASDSVPKPSTASASPDRPRSASGVVKLTGSTASNLAALYQSQGSVESADPLIDRWRKKHQANIKQPRREETTRNVLSFASFQNKQTDSSNKDVSSGIPASSSLTASSSKLPTGSGSGSGSRTVTDKSQTAGASMKNGHFPIRQVARKTGGGSRPPKRHFFDRQITSSNGNASDESLPTGSDSSLVSSGTKKRKPYVRKQNARKGSGGQPPARMLLSQLVKKEQIMASKRRNSDPEVISIDSSSDELTSAKVVRKSRPNHNLITRPLVPGVSKRTEQTERRQTYGGSSSNLPAASHSHKGKGKSLVDDIIDLTLDDSDEAPKSIPAALGSAETSKRLNLEEIIPTSHSSPPKTPPTSQVPGSPPIKPPPFSSTTIMKNFIRRQTMAAVVSSPSKDEPGPRSRSVPPSAGPDLPMMAETSRSTASPRPISSDEDGPASYARPSRLKRVIQSPDEVVSDSDVIEEREVYKAVLRGTRLSSNEAHDTNENGAFIQATRTSSSSPDLIPPLRASPASSPSETDNLVPLTDAESPPDSSPSPGPGKPTAVALTYGGFKALTWEDHKRDFKNLGLTYYSAKDLPTALPDSINRLSEYTRMNPGLRDVFRAYMLENIMDDEANAPDVEVINNIDREPTPLFEFVYSNRIWYGEGVPLPDYSKLQGCGCIGKCDPKSMTCSCAQRQRKYLDMEEGCVYDKFGRLKYPGYPIFECNEMCSCDDECRNRVVQHGRKHQVSITKTENKGWGIFNGSKRIPAGSFIGIYAGELLTDEQSEMRGHYYDKIGKTYLFDVDFWHLKPQDNPDDWHNKYTIDAYHAGNFTRFLNHSCDPNARLYPCYINEPDIEKPLLVVFSIRDVEPYEEICFNYMGRYSEDDDDEVEDEVEKRLDPVYAICRCGARNCVGKFF